MHATPLAVLAGLLVFAGSAAQAQHPDLTGIYKLDKAASRMDSLGPGPSDLDRGLVRIERRGSGFHFQLSMIRNGRADSDTMTLTPDGRESVLPGEGLRQVTSTRWAGDTLTTTIRMTGPEGEAVSQMLCYLTDGGRTLEMRSRLVSPNRSDGRVQVFRRSGPGAARP